MVFVNRMPPKRKASAGAELAVKAAKPGRRQQRQADPPESQAGPSVDQQLPVNQPPSQQDVLAQILAVQQRAEARFDLLAKEVGTLKTQMVERDQSTSTSVLNRQTGPSVVNDDWPTQQHDLVNMQNCRGASNDVLFSNNNPARQQVPLQSGALNVGG